MRGKKRGDEQREMALALLDTDRSVNSVAKELGLPYSTVRAWQIQHEKDKDCAEIRKQKANQAYQPDSQDIRQLREKRKAEFVERSWDIIRDAQFLLKRNLKKAIDNEDEPTMQIDSRSLSTVLGTIYDKQALASNEATQNVTVEGLKFEDL